MSIWPRKRCNKYAKFVANLIHSLEVTWFLNCFCSDKKIEGKTSNKVTEYLFNAYRTWCLMVLKRPTHLKLLEKSYFPLCTSIKSKNLFHFFFVADLDFTQSPCVQNFIGLSLRKCCNCKNMFTWYSVFLIEFIFAPKTKFQQCKTCVRSEVRITFDLAH